MTPPRPTPETDQEWDRLQQLPGGGYSSTPAGIKIAFGMATWAASLERQRDEARETLARLRQDLADPPADVQEAVLDKLNLRSVITERDEARQQLERIAKEGFDDQDTISLEPYADYVLRKLAEERSIMRELLEALQSASRFVDCYTAETSAAIDDKWATARICNAALTKAKQMLP